jgi:hypothetical protein
MPVGKKALKKTTNANNLSMMPNESVADYQKRVLESK